MIEKSIVCPYCGGMVPVETTVCPDCHEDLAALVRLEYEHHILYNQALAHAKDGDLASARRKVTAALERSSTFVQGYRLLAKIAVAQGDWGEARRCVGRAVELAPGDPDVVRLAGDVEAAVQKGMPRPTRRVRTIGAEAGRRDVTRNAVQAGVGVTAVVGAILSWLGGKDES